MLRYSAIVTALGVLVASPATVFGADAEGLPGGEAEMGAIARQCMTDLQAFDDELARVGFGVLPPGGYGTSAPQGYYTFGIQGTPRQKIRSLRDAAYVYALEGDEQSCQMVLASMRQVYEEHQKLVGAEADDPTVRMAWRRAHLSRAAPIGQMDHLMRAKVLLGSALRNSKDQKLGEIKDLVLDPAKPEILYALVAQGGFLGIGESLVAVRWSDLRATEDHEIYVLDVPSEALEEAPKVDRHNFAKTADAEWQGALSAYWEGILKP